MSFNRKMTLARHDFLDNIRETFGKHDTACDQGITYGLGVHEESEHPIRNVLNVQGHQRESRGKLLDTLSVDLIAIAVTLSTGQDGIGELDQITAGRITTQDRIVLAQVCRSRG